MKKVRRESWARHESCQHRRGDEEDDDEINDGDEESDTKDEEGDEKETEMPEVRKAEKTVEYDNDESKDEEPETKKLLKSYNREVQIIWLGFTDKIEFNKYLIREQRQVSERAQHESCQPSRVDEEDDKEINDDEVEEDDG